MLCNRDGITLLFTANFFQSLQAESLGAAYHGQIIYFKLFL